MAKVSGPLLSMDASGTVANAFTFSKWKGRNYVRQRVIPSNPQTAAQTAVRSMFAGLVMAYQANTPEIKSAFEARAKATNVSAFNAFVGFNQKRASEGKFAADTLTPTDAPPLNDATDLDTQVTGKYVTLTWTDALDPEAWMYAIYRALAADPTGVQAQLIGVVGAGVETMQDGPLASGAWHYVIRAISKNGGATAPSAAVIANVV
jgi:hypothetical protein